jgi:acyl-homoserine-lactone acylase
MFVRGVVAACGLWVVAAGAVRGQAPELWTQVEVLRTKHGVPHVRAESMRAAGYALGWLQCEDYGDVTPLRLWATRGQTARVNGRRSVDADFATMRERVRAIETYHLLEPATRDFYEGFAAGVNRYLLLHPGEVPAHVPTDFSGYDVATLHIGDAPPAARLRRLLETTSGNVFWGQNAELLSNSDVSASKTLPDVVFEDGFRDPEEGSNAWALAPSRTKSRRAILLRNPHLAWDAGYYEAHVTVPGQLDFYGDFRIGGPLGVVGGFNKHLGWATTNSNSGDRTEIYAIDRDPTRPDHYRLDGVSLPITVASRTVDYLDDDRLVPETREFWSTPLGPVVHRDDTRIYVARTAGDGEYRAGEQFLRMMRATSQAQWLDVMRMRALVSSNYTYADRAGNILILWNAALPWLPHAPGAPAAVAAPSLRDIWTQLIPFEDLPLTRNPRGGYVHNENDSPHFANMREPVVLENTHANIEPPSLDLRSQHALELIDTNRRLSLEDVVKLKHSYRMLLADRVKPDLLRAVADASPTPEVAAAATVLRRWDNTASPTSRGAVLFEHWWQRYSQGRTEAQQFARPWLATDPRRTPSGLADLDRAVSAFTEAVADVTTRFGSVDVPWGDVYRVRRGDVDVPVGGCPGARGCFRVLGFARQEDGKYAANTGDGWVLAVEFGDEPRAYSVLAYGQSNKRTSPWHADQAAMFARGDMKPVRFLGRDVDRHVVVRYRPGAPSTSEATTGR